MAPRVAPGRAEPGLPVGGCVNAFTRTARSKAGAAGYAWRHQVRLLALGTRARRGGPGGVSAERPAMHSVSARQSLKLGSSVRMRSIRVRAARDLVSR